MPRPRFSWAVEIGNTNPSCIPAEFGRQCHRADFGRRSLRGLLLPALPLQESTLASSQTLLHLRLRAQFRGENLNESVLPLCCHATTRITHPGWAARISQSVAAVFEKEMRYLARSGPMLLTLIMPIFMLLIFRFGAMNSLRHSNSFARTPDMAFPGAAAYAILVLTNLVFNSFGGDGGGIQFFYASPVTFRQIVLAKNLTPAASSRSTLHLPGSPFPTSTALHTWRFRLRRSRDFCSLRP